jgi:hypothetical protein
MACKIPSTLRTGTHTNSGHIEGKIEMFEIFKAIRDLTTGGGLIGQFSGEMMQNRYSELVTPHSQPLKVGTSF